MNTTTRRHPRTIEQAFGPNAWPITGPYRRGGGLVHVLMLALRAGVCIFLAAAFAGYVARSVGVA